MSRYLVTGSAGFLGRNLVKSLLSHGHEVRAMVQSEADARRVDAPSATVVTADVLNLESLRVVVAGVEIVCHCAAKLPGSSGPDEIWEVNVTGTANLVTACLGAGVRRIVYISTESVYGDCISLPATEETPVNTDHVYEGNYPRSKLEGENLVMRAWRDHGLEVAVIRVCLIYGPGDSAGTRQIHQWAARRIHLLIDGGRSRISTVYVTDVADAIECAAENQRAVGRIYNVTDGAAVTKREIFEMIAEVTRKPKVYFPIPGRPLYALFYGLHAVLSPFISASSSLLDPRRILFSMAHHELESGRIRRELGYEPRVTLREGLRRVFADAPSLKSLYRTDRSGPEGTR